MNRKRYSEIKFEKAKAIINELTKLLINMFSFLLIQRKRLLVIIFTYTNNSSLCK